MPIFEVPSRAEHGSYTALIGAEEKIDFGYIRIEPPFTPSDDMMERMQGRGFEFDFEMTDQDCTAIAFYEQYPDFNIQNNAKENLEIVVETTDLLLASLGRISCKRDFIDVWSRATSK